MLRTRQVRARGESRRRKRIRGGRGAAVANNIKKVVAVAIYTPPLMALQQVSASAFGVSITVRLLAPRVY